MLQRETRNAREAANENDEEDEKEEEKRSEMKENAFAFTREGRESGVGLIIRRAKEDLSDVRFPRGARFSLSLSRSSSISLPLLRPASSLQPFPAPIVVGAAKRCVGVS